MKRLFLISLICLLLLVGCKSEETKNSPSDTASPETTESNEGFVQLPRGLEGEWMSASDGERGYSEMITFRNDFTLTVTSLKDGVAQQSIDGTFRIEGDKILYDITEGTTPYSGEFKYILEGRELYLIDDDEPAHYLRTS